MKIAFVGKGGSGKTTLSALIARTLAQTGLPVLAIDADINQHLARTLGMSAEEAQRIPPMGLEITKIKEYLRGTNPHIPSAEVMIKTTPPGLGSRLVNLRDANTLFEHFARSVEGMRVMAVGPFSEEDLGVRCYHSKTGSVELLLNHLIDEEKEYVLVDMTAGADAFASGLFTRFDVTFLVVEPTEKSVSVYEQYKRYAKHHEVCIKVIGNKIGDADDTAFLKERVGEDLIAQFSNSGFVKRTDRGEHQRIDDLEKENQAAIKAVIQTIDRQKKEWTKFYRQAVEFHQKNARGWANAEAGIDLTTQIDPRFDLVRFVR